MSLTPQTVEERAPRMDSEVSWARSDSTRLGALQSLTAIVLTFNEDMHIERCVRSARQIAARVCIVDSFSTDRTREVAAALGAEIHTHAFKNYADQFQWALETVGIESEWVLRLDADEYLDDALIADLLTRLPGLPTDVSGIAVRLKVIFQGRFLRFGGYYTTDLLRIFRRSAGRMEQRWMDEHITLSHGRTIKLLGNLVHDELKPFHFWVEKHNRYATRAMLDFINLDTPLFEADRRMRAADNRQAHVRRLLKEKVYHRLPLYSRAFLLFLYRYVLRLGFLDGRQGFIFHFNHSLWYRLLEAVKVDEARSYIAEHGVDAFKDHIRRSYRLDI
ncbi:MAG: glycosyltransferase family 2 protein [Beijerinckiaceae bacterium]|nr:glycosyltransferase family 2 protein [Beijerinckiaceae bacterium]